MSDIQLYLVEVTKNKDEAKRIAQQTASRLSRRELKLISLVESIGEYVNNDDTNLRANSLAYLADVLESLPNRLLTGQQRSLLCDFILSRVQDDNEGTGSCARALIALEEKGKWDQETAAKVMTTFINDTHPLKQHRLQSERFAILQLIDLLLATYRTAIARHHEHDQEFLATFISYFDGEKDPRNLMIVFSILQVPMTEWELGPNTQDLFDSVFNYFPITFKPPPGDPYGITSQDLKDRLRDCIAATSDFAPYAFPALLDKLDSSSMNTKRDVIQAINACIGSYEPRTISLYSVTLWDALKYEILNVEEEDIAQDSLQALALIARQLPQASAGALNAYLKPIIKECNEHIEDAPTKQSQAAGRIMNSVAKASPDVADFITKAVLPHLFVLFQASESISKRRGLIEVLNSIVQAIIVVSVHWQIKDADGIIIRDRASDNALRPFSSDALHALLRAVTNAPKAEVSFRLYAIEGLTGLIKVRQLLAEDDVTKVVEACVEIVIREPQTGTNEVKPAAIKLLTETAQHYPSVVGDRALPAFLAELPDCPEPGLFTYEPVLEAFAKLSSESLIADTVILRLKNKLNAALQQQAPRSYILALLASLLYIFTHGSPGREEGAFRMSYFWDLAKPLLDRALGLGLAAEPLLSSEASVDVIGRICTIILRSQSSHAQNQAYASFERLFDSLNAEQPTPEAERSHHKGSKLGLIASLHLHAAFQRDGVAPEKAASLLQTLSHVAKTQSVTPAVFTATLRHTSLVLNKFIAPLHLNQSLEDAGANVDTLLGISSATSPNAIMLAFAVAKGLTIQGKSAKVVSLYLQRLLELLSDPIHGPTAARGFATLLSPDDILSKENHCIVSGLYKQRTFNQIIPAIATAIKTADSTIKSNYLVALSGILRWLPYTIIEPSLSTLVTLLLQLLDLEGAQYQSVKAATLITLESVTLYNASAVAEHASSYIGRLLNCTTAPTNIPDVRKGALRCLTHIVAQLKPETVMPYRRQVVKRLLSCLDDGKRVVRTEAVRCRTAWLGLDDGDEEEDE